MHGGVTGFDIFVLSKLQADLLIDRYQKAQTKNDNTFTRLASRVNGAVKSLASKLSFSPSYVAYA
jgi:hypothetical protein